MTALRPNTSPGRCHLGTGSGMRDARTGAIATARSTA
jgi:hypothetical protein